MGTKIATDLATVHQANSILFQCDVDLTVLIQAAYVI